MAHNTPRRSNRELLEHLTRHADETAQRVEHLIRQARDTNRRIQRMGNIMSDLTDAVDDLTAATTEIEAEVSELEAKVAAGEDVGPSVARIKALAADLRAAVPDVPSDTGTDQGDSTDGQLV